MEFHVVYYLTLLSASTCRFASSPRSRTGSRRASGARDRRGRPARARRARRRRGRHRGLRRGGPRVPLRPARRMGRHGGGRRAPRLARSGARSFARRLGYLPPPAAELHRACALPFAPLAASRARAARRPVRCPASAGSGGGGARRRGGALPAAPAGAGAGAPAPRRAACRGPSAPLPAHLGLIGSRSATWGRSPPRLHDLDRGRRAALLGRQRLLAAPGRPVPRQHERGAGRLPRPRRRGAGARRARRAAAGRRPGAPGAAGLLRGPGVVGCCWPSARTRRLPASTTCSSACRCSTSPASRGGPRGRRRRPGGARRPGLRRAAAPGGPARRVLTRWRSFCSWRTTSRPRAGADDAAAAAPRLRPPRAGAGAGGDDPGAADLAGRPAWTSVYLWYATRYRKPLLNGYSPAAPRSYVERVFPPLYPLDFGDLRRPQYDLLKSLGIRFIVFHEEVYPPKISDFPFRLRWRTCGPRRTWRPWPPPRRSALPAAARAAADDELGSGRHSPPSGASGRASGGMAGPAPGSRTRRRRRRGGGLSRRAGRPARPPGPPRGCTRRAPTGRRRASSRSRQRRPAADAGGQAGGPAPARLGRAAGRLSPGRVLDLEADFALSDPRDGPCRSSPTVGAGALGFSCWCASPPRRNRACRSRSRSSGTWASRSPTRRPRAGGRSS